MVALQLLRYWPRHRPIAFVHHSKSFVNESPSFCCNKPFAIARHRTIVHLPPLLLPPLVFGGLAFALWTWKCFMMIVFQNRIIYMPGLPPNARREKISDYVNQCGGITWREQRIVTTDGVEIALCVANIVDSTDVEGLSYPPLYILYFQGNASSLPPRLPLLSAVLRILRDDTVKAQGVKTRENLRAAATAGSSSCTMVCVSYRGYWTSKGRPSERGIAADAASALEWVASQRPKDSVRPVPVVLWGQSIGAGVATNLAAHLGISSKAVDLRMLILETPFTSVRDMLETLYPQKWLPYRHLWPFLLNHLDSLRALQQLAQQSFASRTKIVILEAGRDELVPKSHGDALEKRCHDLGLDVTRHVIGGALHTEVMSRPAGRRAAAAAIRTVAMASSASEIIASEAEKGRIT